MEETTTSAAVLNYLASREKQGKLATPQQNEQAAAYRSMARTAEKTKSLTRQEEQGLMDKLREAYQRMFSRDTINYKQLNFARTYLHYKFGNGSPMYIDITGLHFPNVSASRHFNDERGKVTSVNLFNISQLTEAGITLGKVELRYLGNKKVEIAKDDTYDFNIERNNGLSIRNIATFLGSVVH